MKIALCFIISYNHILNKEVLWREWIEPNKDIINVYFYYKELNKIKSEWILKHAIPEKYIFETSYYHVIPAYVSSMNFAIIHDKENQWFCLLTDSCCPIISPKRFRYLFYKLYNKSIMSWRKAWWNIQFHKRANLSLLPEELRLANDPWFILNRQNVTHCINFIKTYPDLVNTISSGGLANESLFAIAMYICNQLQTKNVICGVTHLTDWSRMTSPTSPYLFKNVSNVDIKFIDDSLETNKYAVFIRKVAPEFPDEILRQYIFEKDESKLVIREPFIFLYNRHKKYAIYYFITIIVLINLFSIWIF